MKREDIRFLRFPATLFTLVVLGALLERGRFLFLPLTVALLLSMVFRPLVDALERRRVPAMATIALVLVFVAGSLAWVGGVVIDSARGFAESVDLGEMMRPAEGGGGLDEIRSVLSQELEGLRWRDLDAHRALELVKRVVPRLAGVLAAAATMIQGLVTQTFLVLLFLGFLFTERRVLGRKVALIAGERRSRAEAVLERAMADVQRYLAVKTVISVATGSVCWLGLAVLGVPYAAVFGFLTFLLNYIPNIGSVLAVLFPFVAAWADRGTLTTPLLVLLLYLAVNIGFGSVLEPRVLGKQLNLSPLVVLAALLFWGALWGIPGMFLAIPLTRTLQLVALNVPDVRWLGLLLSHDPDAAARRFGDVPPATG